MTANTAPTASAADDTGPALADVPLLTYSLGPDHLDAAARNAELMLIATNKTGKDVTVTRLTLRVPRGRGENDLTIQTKEGVGVNTPDGWDTYAQDLINPTRIELGAEYSGSDGKVVPHNGTVTFTLTGITVNGRPGVVPLTACEYARDDTLRTKPLALSKTTPGFVFRDFRPDPYMIDANHRSTSLTWKTQKPPKTAVVYWLTCTTDSGPSRPINVSNRTSHPLAPITNTLCLLTAELTPATGPKTTATLNTQVLVARPTVSTHKLSVDRTVSLLNRPLAEGGPVPGYTSSDWRKDPIESPRATFTADTDGLLLATVRSRLSGKVATVRIELSKSGTSLATLNVRAGVTERTCCLPVPAKHTVTLTTTLSDNPDEKWYLLALDWRPFGVGRLTQ
ncbi:hypothetical protein [Streptomyces sp. NPDC037389]|uniref:hypothetical protein n=1 Tax=Streptomyces sp. NPDC037389 TaxID=3155369 RepID=UPI0033EFC7B7